MSILLWARWDEREDGTHALGLFRRVVVDTPRGEALEDVPVLVVEDAKKKLGELPRAVLLELDVNRDSDGSIAVMARAVAADKEPTDPKPKRKKFDDPESERKRKARGMGRFLGKEDKSKPASTGATPPVPREARVGGRGSARGRRKRGAAVRGAPRGGGKK